MPLMDFLAASPMVFGAVEAAVWSLTWWIGCHLSVFLLQLALAAAVVVALKSCILPGRRYLYCSIPISHHRDI